MKHPPISDPSIGIGQILMKFGRYVESYIQWIVSQFHDNRGTYNAVSVKHPPISDPIGMRQILMKFGKYVESYIQWLVSKFHENRGTCSFAQIHFSNKGM